MIICESCRAENWDGAQSCVECGKLLRRASTRPVAQSFKPPIDQEPRAGEQRQPPRAPSSPPRAPSSPPPMTGASSGASNTAAGGDNGSHAVLSFPDPSSAAPVVRSASAGAEAQRAPVLAHARLVINRGRAAGKEFPVHEDEAYIGRWDADSGIFPDVDLDADDPEAKVSRRHARITRRGAQYFIEDLGSTNGTFINRGRRLLPGDRQPLNDGDEIIIGKTFLRFQIVK
jgi:hypothetical protein